MDLNNIQRSDDHEHSKNLALILYLYYYNLQLELLYTRFNSSGIRGMTGTVDSKSTRLTETIPTRNPPEFVPIR